MAFATIQEAVNSTVLLTNTKKSKHGKHRENYHRDYYLKNKEKFLAYSHDYYGVKKLLSPYLKEKKMVLNNFFPSHTHIKEHSQREKELFFVGGGVKENFARRLDQKYLRMPTKNKIPQKKGWNMPWFEEWLDKSGLLKKYREWGIRGGKKIGDKYLSFLDLDIRKDGLEPWRIKQLEKNVGLLLDYLGCFHVKTKKGFHVYLLTEELLPNQNIYHVDSWLEKEQIIGSIQSQGKYVVGFDSPDKKLVEKGKWFWHVKDSTEVKKTLARFFLSVGREQEKKVEDYLLEIQRQITVKKSNVDNTFNIKKSFSEQDLRLEKNIEQPRKFSVKAQILSKQKTCLAELWKVFYLNQNTQQNGYFLVNDYQKLGVLDNLGVGSVRNMLLMNGFKHQFLSRVLE